MATTKTPPKLPAKPKSVNVAGAKKTATTTKAATAKTTVKPAPKTTVAKIETAKPAVKAVEKPVAVAKPVKEVAVDKKPKAVKKVKKEIKGKKLKVTYVKSVICSLPKQRKTMKALGFKTLNQVKVFPDNDAIRGMIFIVKHLVEVEEIKE